MGDVHSRVGHNPRAGGILILKLAYSKRMKKTRLIYSTLAIAFGIFMVVYGEMDDSPGGQLLGLLAVILGMVGVIKSRKKNYDQKQDIK